MQVVELDLYGIGGVYQLESIGDLNCLAVLDLFRSHVEGGLGGYRPKSIKHVHQKRAASVAGDRSVSLWSG